MGEDKRGRDVIVHITLRNTQIDESTLSLSKDSELFIVHFIKNFTDNELLVTIAFYPMPVILVISLI